jgi:hypothetical protein
MRYRGPGSTNPALEQKMTVQNVFAAVGGVVLLLVLIGFVRSLWRKPPKEPGSQSDTGGLPPGAIG